jgi:hypothetical protein
MSTDHDPVMPQCEFALEVRLLFVRHRQAVLVPPSSVAVNPSSVLLSRRGRRADHSIVSAHSSTSFLPEL